MNPRQRLGGWNLGPQGKDVAMFWVAFFTIIAVLISGLIAFA